MTLYIQTKDDKEVFLIKPLKERPVKSYYYVLELNEPAINRVPFYLAVPPHSVIPLLGYSEDIGLRTFHNEFM